MPTAAERAGDFSKSITGSRTRSIQPTQSWRAISGNIIPKSRFGALRRSMLNSLPTPDYVDPTNVNNSNYKSTYSGASEREDMVPYRLQHHSPFAGVLALRSGRTAANSSIDSVGSDQLRPAEAIGAHHQRHHAPTLVNEFVFGMSKNKLYFYPTDASQIDRSKVGNPGQWYQNSTTSISCHIDKTNYMPNITSGGNHANPAVATFGNVRTRSSPTPS